jgi:hypothetical protein
MKESADRMTVWTPRALAIALALFLSVFALDVFEEGLSGGQIAVHLFIHLIPSFVILAVLAVAWRFERMGAFLYLVLALFSLWFFRANGSGQAITAGPLFVLSALFLWSAHHRGTAAVRS